jgi:nucleotide-binding universal stress UspA family protein
MKNMFGRIGVLLNGSARAELALPVAARLARAAAGTVVLLHVVDPAGDLAPYYPSDLEVVQEMIHDEKVAAHGYLEGIAHGSQLADVRTVIAVRCGQPAPRIFSEVDASRIDLLVMCTHRYDGMKRWTAGSLAEEIVDQAVVPALVLREEHASSLASCQRVSGSVRALVPLDGSMYAEAALIPAAQLVAALSAPFPGALHLTRVAVLPDAEGSSESERNAILQQARQSLESTVERLRESLYTASVAELPPSLSRSVTIDGDVASGISRLAEDSEDAAVPESVERADMIVMATRGFGGLQRYGVGSVTGRVLHMTRLPLLIVRPFALECESSPSQDEAMLEKQEQAEVV